MKLNIILFLAIVVCSVIANCPIEGKVHVQKTEPIVPIDDYNNFILLQRNSTVVKLQMRRDKTSLVLV